MSDVNDDKVATTVVLSLEALVTHMQSVLPGVSFVYDDSLGYETGISEMRAANNLPDKFKGKLPVFFFKRSVLRPAEEGQGRRSVTNRVTVPGLDQSSANTYKSLLGMYDVDFEFVSTKMSEIENFEISWLTESGIPSKKELQVTLPNNIGNLSYFVKYGLLDEKLINSSGNYYKTITGTMQVRGWQLAFAGSAALIREINLRIFAFSTSVQALKLDTHSPKQPSQLITSKVIT